MEPEGTRSGAQAVERAIKLLDCFADDDPELSLARLAGASGLPKSTTYRIAEALVRGGLIERDERSNRYRVSLLTAVLGRRALVPLGLDEVQPQLYALAAGIKLTVSLAVADADDMVTILSARPPVSFCHHQLPAARERVRASAMGKAVLAFEGSAVTEMADDLVQVRRRGYAVSHSPRDDTIRAVAVPVFTGRRQVWGALGVQALEQRLTDGLVAQILPALQQYAGGIGRALRKSAVAPSH